MITGDHAITAEAIARQLGHPGRAITGAEFSAMSDEQADQEIDDIGVIARVAPEDKVRLDYPMIGCVQMFVTPGIRSAASISATSFSRVIPARHSLSGFR